MLSLCVRSVKYLLFLLLQRSIVTEKAETAMPEIEMVVVIGIGRIVQQRSPRSETVGGAVM